jgi:ABC-type enterochelin transport system permease subunit
MERTEVSTVKKNGKKSRVLTYGILIVALLILSIVSISIGAEEFHLMDLLRGNGKEYFLVNISRLPRTFSIIITGA